MTTNRSIRKKLLAKHSYAVLLFPSLSRSFYFLTAFYFSPLTFDCHRFIQLSFTDKRARSHRLYRWDIECSLPFLFNAYSINWRGITSNDFIGRWIKQIMPARTVLKIDNVDKRGEIVFRRIEVEKRKGEEREGESNDLRGAICETHASVWRTCFSSIFRESFGDVSRSSRYFLLFSSFFCVFRKNCEKVKILKSDKSDCAKNFRR